MKKYLAQPRRFFGGTVDAGMGSIGIKRFLLNLILIIQY